MVLLAWLSLVRLETNWKELRAHITNTFEFRVGESAPLHPLIAALDGAFALC